MQLAPLGLLCLSGVSSYICAISNDASSTENKRIYITSFVHISIMRVFPAGRAADLPMPRKTEGPRGILAW